MSSHSVTATPTSIVDNSSSSSGLLVNLQFRATSAGAVCRVASATSAPASTATAYLAVAVGDKLATIRVAGGEHLYAWGDAGVVVDNHY